MNPISRDVTARNSRTRVLQLGQGTPCVFIHGFLSNHHTFDDIVTNLAESFHIVTLDLPGTGESEKPSPNRFDYSIEAFAEVVTDVIAALQVGRCHLIGHGLGASIALTLATEHPEFVDHLVLISPELYPGPPPPLARIMRLPLIGGFLFKQLLGRRVFRLLHLKHMYAPGHVVTRERFDAYFDAFSEPAARESALAILHGQLDKRPCIARLSRIKSPTLVVWGRADKRLSAEYAPRITRQIPSAHLEFIDSGHSPHEERPEQFTQSVMRFLENERP